MRIAVPAETQGAETRVAATPETVRKFIGLGADVAVEKGAGLASGITDSEYEAAGAKLSATAAEALAGADIVLKVRRPAESEIAGLPAGALVVGIMDPYGSEAQVEALAKANVSAFAMEFMPRITRAQVMDVLSSQANLAGYRAVVDGAAEYGRALPMMMTAAGTVPAAKIFIMGVGVAGLQAIATARRMGAIVTATDVRPATKEQVESLGLEQRNRLGAAIDGADRIARTLQRPGEVFPHHAVILGQQNSDHLYPKPISGVHPMRKAFKKFQQDCIRMIADKAPRA